MLKSKTRDLFGVDQVEVRAWHQIGKELKIETNVGDMKMTVRRTPDYFVEFIRNGETMLKSKTDVTPATFTTTIDTLVYMPSTAMLHKMFCLYGKGCFNKRQGHMKVVVDRVNKNAFMNKFSFDSTVMKDDRMALEMSVSTMTAPYTFHMNAPYFLPRFFNDINRKTIDATITHQMGSKLEVKSNCPEFETFIVTTTGNKRSVVLNGKELTVVDFKRGDRTISQTTELPSGEHLTTTVEWTADTLKKNQATVTVEITPNRKFKGIFGWDFQTMTMGNFNIDVKGENPWVGDYAIDRQVNWNLSRPEYMFNWVGKSVFKTGPFFSFSPINFKLPAVVVEVDLGVDGGEGEEGTGLEHGLAHPVEHVLGPAQVPVDLPVNGIVAHPGVLALHINVEVAHGHGLEVPAEDALELPVGSDIDGDGGLVLLEGVGGPLDGGGEVLSAGQLGRLADCPVSPLEVDDGQLLSVEDDAPLVAGGRHNECLELGAVALHLQLASHLVGDRRINCLPVDVVEESGKEVGGVHVECVGSGHGRHSHLKGHPVVLHDGGFEAELVGESILVDPVNDDLHVSLPLVEAALAIQAEHLVEHGSAGQVEEGVDGGGEGGGGDIGLGLQHGLPVPDELDKVVWGAPHGHLHVPDIGLDLQLLSNLVPSSHFDLVNSKEVPGAAHPPGADRLVPDQGVGSLGCVKLLLLELLSIHHTLVLEEHLAHHEVLVLLVVHDLGVPGSVGEALANLPAEEFVEDRHWVHVEVALHVHVEHVGIVDQVNFMVELGEGGSAAG